MTDIRFFLLVPEGNDDNCNCTYFIMKCWNILILTPIRGHTCNHIHIVITDKSHKVITVM